MDGTGKHPRRFTKDLNLTERNPPGLMGIRTGFKAEQTMLTDTGSRIAGFRISDRYWIGFGFKAEPMSINGSKIPAAGVAGKSENALFCHRYN